MTDGPIFSGTPRMVSPFKYCVVHVNDKTVEAFFVSKTLADKTVNDWNHTIGEGKIIWATCKIFPDN